MSIRQFFSIRRLIGVFVGVVVAGLIIVLVGLHMLTWMFIGHDPEGVARESLERPGGSRISYLMSGDPGSGPRLIYVHGTPGDSTNFAAYIADPVQGLESISLDRPGFGHTIPAEPVLTLHDQAAIVEPFLVERDGHWPILIGHSLGATIICRAAVEYPDRVGGLVLLSAAMDPELESVKWYQEVADFALVAWALPRAMRNANRELFPLREELVALRPLLERIECPVAILHAPDDVLVPFENVEYMRETLPTESVVAVHELPGKDHFIPWNAELSVRDAITEVVHILREESEVSDVESAE